VRLELLESIKGSFPKKFTIVQRGGVVEGFRDRNDARPDGNVAALQAARIALQSGPLGYTEALGDKTLRSAIAHWYRARHAVEVSPDRIVITTGASGGFQLAFLALLAEGEKVLMARPGYPPYRQILAALGFAAEEVETQAEDGFQLTAAAVRTATNVRAALVASPANPTGAILPDAALAALATACRDRAIALISDEIYHGLHPQGAAVTALAHDQDAIVINSFSKYWAMTGWRIGWMVVPERLIAPIERLAQNLTICPPTISQAAALAALTAGPCIEAHAARIEANRAAIMAALPRLRLPAAAASQGAFYAMIDVSAHDADSFAFCTRALDEAGVALTPGIDFDPLRGARWARLAFARGGEEVAEGLARLAKWLSL
jgi:aspartate/methionine/tyrosine aminotransferase